MTDDAPGVELAIRAQPMPLSPDEAKAAMELYQAHCRSLLTPEDFQPISGKDFPKRSAMQKLSAAYNCSTKIISDRTDYDENGEIIRANIVVRATSPNGRYQDGDGACSIHEPNFRKGNPKADHNIHATAVTRAKNRAIGDLVAFGAVSAEEAEGTAGAAPGGVSLPAWAAPVDVGTAAKALHHLLENAGVPQDGRHKIVTAIGNATLDQCDGGFPKAVLDVITRINEELFTAHAAEELDGTEVTSESDLDTPAGRAADAMAEDFARAAEEDKNTITTEDEA